MTASAYDFSADNAQGQTIYYNITDADALTIEVTCSYHNSYIGQYGSLAGQDVVIPSTVEYNGKTYTVTAIGDYAFHALDLELNGHSSNTGIRSIVLPHTVKSIGLWAFGETQYKSISYSFALNCASREDMMPSCSPLGPIKRTCGKRTFSLTKSPLSFLFGIGLPLNGCV